MIYQGKFRRGGLRGGTALSALAMLGAGLGGTFVAAVPAAAQDISSGELRGVVQDSAGNAVPGATVTIRATNRAVTRTATTGSSGTFNFTALPIGNYTIEVASSVGAATVTEAAAALGGASYTVVVGGGAEGEEIVVTGRQARSLDFSQTATGAVFDVQETAERVPVPRTLESVALLAPQVVSGDQTFSEDYPNGTIALGGSSIAENIYYINGMNVTNFRTFIGGSTVPFEFYDQVQVKTGGYQAEFGRSTGGALIAVSRSGSNEWRGGANAFFSPASLRATSPDTYINANSQDRDETIEGNIWASGPIIKNRLYAFAFFNPRHETGFDINVEGTTAVTQVSKTPFYGGKIDLDLFQGHRFELTYFNDSNRRIDTISYRDGGDEYKRSSEYRFTGGENYIGRYTGAFTDWLTVSALFGRSKYIRRTTGTDASVPYTVDINFSSPTNVTELQGIGDLIDNGEDQRDLYRADADIFVNLLGDHHFRFGVDHEILKADNVSGYSGGIIHYFYRNRTSAPLFAASGAPIQPGEGYLRQITYLLSGQFENQNTAFYLQDNWDVTDRLQLSLGIRNDRFRNLGNNGIEFVDLKNQWAPRLGATYDLTGDRRTRLSAFFGRYYLPVAANTNLRMAGQEQYFQEYTRFTGPLTNPTPVGEVLSRTVFSDVTNPDPTTLVSRNLEPQYLDEFIIGAERRFGSRWRVGLNVTHRKLGSVLEDSDLNVYTMRAFCADNPATCGGEEDLSVGSGGYVLLNPGKDVIINVSPQGGFAGGEITIPAEYVALPKAKRKYWGVELSFDREWDGAWMLSGSYTWSKTRGNYEGGVKSDTGQDDVGLTQDFDEPGWTDGAYGYLPNDRRHQFKLYGAFSVTKNLTVGANARVVSGRSYGCLGIYPLQDGRAQDPYEDGGYDSWYCGNRDDFGIRDTDDDGPLEGVGSVLVGRGGAFRGAWEKRLDLNVAYRIPVDGLRNVQVRADVFNVFNFDSPIDYREYGDDDSVIAQDAQGRNIVPLDPHYAKPTIYQTPRYVRFGLSLDF